MSKDSKQAGENAAPTRPSGTEAPAADKKPKHAKHAAEPAPGYEESELDDAFDDDFAAMNPTMGAPASAKVPDVERKRRNRKIAAITGGVIVALLAIVYGVGVFFFSGHFLPNTWIGREDISLQSAEEVREYLGDVTDSYVLEVDGDGFELRLAASEIGLAVDAESVVNSMLSSTSPWAWPIELFGTHDMESHLVAAYDDSGLNDTVRQAVEAFNATATPPVSATIGYSAEEQRVVVIDEVLGTQLDVEAVVHAVDTAVTQLDTKLSLTQDQLLKPAILGDDERLAAAADAATAMVGADMSLTLGGIEVARVNGELLTPWVTLDANFSAALDEAQLTAWVDSLAMAYTTVGAERTYTRPDGKVITVSGGTYGTEVDREALMTLVRDGVAAGQQGTFEIPCTQSTGIPANANGVDWSNRYIDVDLSEQYVRFYDANGAIIWETACITGMPDGEHNTPTGVYYLVAKESPSKLIGYEDGKKIYETTVTYWMPFIGNSIGFHDATWQPGFGGTMYADGYGSHGCVNLSYDAAQSLYGIIQYDDVVVVHW